MPFRFGGSESDVPSSDPDLNPDMDLRIGIVAGNRMRNTGDEAISKSGIGGDVAGSVDQIPVAGGAMNDLAEPPPDEDSSPEEGEDYQSRLEKARKAGWSWSDIWNHLFSSTAAADKAGYTQPEIDQHLGFKDPASFTMNAQASWANQMDADPGVVDDMATGKVDLSAHPDMPADYAKALLAGEVKGPQDFAERYGAAAVAAGHDEHGLPDQDGGLHLAAAAASAAGLAPMLPTREDLADATVALTPENNWLLRPPPEMPGPGFIPGELHLDPVLAPHVPEGEARPFAPGEAIANPDGSWSSEISVSVAGNPALNDGRPTNLPSLWLKDGKAYVAHDEDEATELAIKSKLTFPSYDTMAAAVLAAGARESAWQGQSTADAMFATPLYNRPDGDPATIRKNLMDHWAQTGVGPVEAAIQANSDTNLAQKLIPSATPWAPPTLQELSQSKRDAIEPFGLLTNTELMGTPGHDTALKILEDFGVDIGTYHAVGLLGKYVAKPIMDAVFEHVIQPALDAVIRTGSRVPEWLGDLMENTRVSQVDLTQEPGHAISDVAVTDAIRAPEPATIIPAPATAEGAEPGLPTFSPTSTPSERIARIAQDAPEMPGADYFTRAITDMGETDPATIDLARGHDDTAKLSRWWRDIWSDESGTVETKDLLAGTIAARDAGRDFGEMLIKRISTGIGTQKTEHIAQAAEAFFKDLSPFMPRYEREIAKPGGGDWINTEVGQLLDAVDTGRSTVHPDSPLFPLYKFMKATNDEQMVAINAAVERGDMNPVQLREFYISHMYTPESIGAVNRGRGTGGVQGSLGFTKGRSTPTYEEAFGEDYKPLHPNPIINMLQGLSAARKALDTVKMQGFARDENWMRYYLDPREAARDGFRPVVGMNSEKSFSTIVTDAEGNKVPGLPGTQRLYAREGLDTFWNNWTRFENRTGPQVLQDAEDALLKMKNTATYIKLIIPMFHTWTMYKESWSTAWSNAAMNFPGAAIKMWQGEPGAALGQIGRGLWNTAKAPIALPIDVITAGLKWRPMYRAMENDPSLNFFARDASAEEWRVLNTFVRGGGTIPSGLNKVYQAGSAPTIWRSFSRGTLTQEIIDDFYKAFAAPATREYGAHGVATDLGSAVGLPFREVARVVTSLNAPIWSHMIPLAKAGGAMSRLMERIALNPTIADDAFEQYGRQVVQNTEDRFGEYDQRNLFWPSFLKRAANATQLSMTWAYGTIAATMRGLGYNPSRGGWNPLNHLEWNPVATTNLAANLAMIAFTNAAWTLAVDGKMPDNKLDYMIPFANWRHATRIIIPGEEKEYYDWMKIAAETYSVYKDKGFAAAAIQAVSSTVAYGFGKFASPYQAMRDWIRGEYFNAEGKMVKLIPTAPGYKDFFMNEFGPIFYNAWDKNAKAGLNWFENLSGFREPAAWFKDWDAWRQGQEKLHNQWTKADVQLAGGTYGNSTKTASSRGGYNDYVEGQQKAARATTGTAAATTHAASTPAARAKAYQDILAKGNADYEKQRNQPAQGTRAGGRYSQPGVINVGAAPRGTVETVHPGNLGGGTGGRGTEETVYSSTAAPPTTILRAGRTQSTRQDIDPNTGLPVPSGQAYTPRSARTYAPRTYAPRGGRKRR